MRVDARNFSLEEEGLAAVLGLKLDERRFVVQRLAQGFDARGSG
jgi:hypothetical protein